MTNKEVFRKALDNHLNYLKDVQETIHGVSDYCGTDHLACPLGKWIYGKGAEDVKVFGQKAMAIFQQLHEPHEQFHISSNKVIQAFSDHKQEEAKRPLSDMIIQSNKLIQLITELSEIAEKK